MEFRNVGWRDLLTLYRYRNRVVCFDSALSLTRGNPLGLPALVSRFNPRNGILTGIVHVSIVDPPVVGQVKCIEGRRSARLTLLMPFDAHESRGLPLLLDGLAFQAGKWGALGLLAEVEETNLLFEDLRRAGFSVYGWQRVYQLPFGQNFDQNQPGLWQFATAADEIQIRQLFHSLVPPLVQAADPLPAGRLYGLVHRVNDQMMAFVESVYGPNGIFLRPLIHPNVDRVSQLLNNLEGYLSPLLGRKVYLSVRSYQSWLESPMTRIAQEAAARQALMVKYLAATQRVSLNNVHRSVIDDTGAEPSPHPMSKNTS